LYLYTVTVHSSAFNQESNNNLQCALMRVWTQNGWRWQIHEVH